MNLELINLNQPGETRHFGRASRPLRRGAYDPRSATYKPGWRWSEHVAPTLGTASGQVGHVGLVFSHGAAVGTVLSGKETP